MDAEWKAKWIADLRANPDAQGEGWLTRIDSQTQEEKDCCLGRLCKLVGANREISTDGIVSYEGLRAMPTKHIYSIVDLWPSGDELALNNFESLRDRAGVPVSLSGCNDDGFTFPQIADLIEYFL